MFKENDVVQLNRNVDSNLTVGEKGTVVFVYPGTVNKYEVEFMEEGTPHTKALITLPEDYLELVRFL